MSALGGAGIGVVLAGMLLPAVGNKFSKFFNRELKHIDLDRFQMSNAQQIAVANQRIS